jgi:acetyl-CoA carboxylase biotin carboxylase subunit
MEVNARLQVEHPVSEFITGTDIVRQQILAAGWGRIELDPREIQLSGWAMECRINALTPGRVTRLEIPGGPGVRFDSCLYAGCVIPPYYDSMAAKLIVHGTDRSRALARMRRALDELIIEGIETNKAEQQRIIASPQFRSGDFGTSFYSTLTKEAEDAL